MKPATLRALQGSIKHWEAIRAGTEGENGRKGCSLCARFGGTDCTTASGEECPVMTAANANSPDEFFYDCDGTPFNNWTRAIRARDGVDKAWADRCAETPRFATNANTRRAATREVKFLQSLLPQ